MLSIEELGDARAAREYTLRGRKIAVRTITAFEWAELDVVFTPEPAPPMRRPPDKGSRHPEVPDFEDPAYKMALARRVIECNAMIAAAVIDLEIPLGSGRITWELARANGRQREYLMDASRRLLETLTRAEIFRLAELAERGSAIAQAPEAFPETPG